MRQFEKISIEQFTKDIYKAKQPGLTIDPNEVEHHYESLPLPKRSTTGSAGYDIHAVGTHTINPGESVKIPTGLKVKMPQDEVLLLIIRSSLSTKHQIKLSNQLAVIDSDYYNNPDNEGHFWITLTNEGTDPFTVFHEDRLVQGIFVQYKTVDNDETTESRTGGFGSTGR